MLLKFRLPDRLKLSNPIAFPPTPFHGSLYSIFSCRSSARRHFSSDRKESFTKHLQKLKKTLENVTLSELLPLKDVVSLHSGEYEPELHDLMDSELLSLYHGSYPQMLKLTDKRFRRLRAGLEEVHSSLFSGQIHRLRDCNKVMLQVRGGVGGEESARFAGELFAMYRNICTDRSYGFVKHSDNSAEVTGATDFFKYEFGVHRVQRVPFNCKRIQTSSAVVTVVPHFDIKNTRLRSSDMHVETMRSSGPGGQSVNKSETAVRVVHIPTGISASIRETSSQIDNKSIALELILKKIREKQERELEMIKSQVKSSQVKTGDRSEKIRTLNFMHDTVTDHRCKLTLNGVEAFLDSGAGIEDIHNSLAAMEDEAIVKFMVENMDLVVEYFRAAPKLK